MIQSAIMLKSPQCNKVINIHSNQWNREVVSDFGPESYKNSEL